MEITYLSILIFLVITIVYYFFSVIGKVSPTLEIMNSVESMAALEQTNYIRLAIYFTAILLSQFIINAIFVVNNCNGLNFGSAFMITFIPWVLIFGIMIMVLITYPGFKSAFSDIVGYFVVSGNANEVLSKILKDGKVSTIMNNVDQTQNSQRVSDLSTAAENIMKLYSNKAILINQITPDNFMKTWETLQPLMKEGVYNNVDTTLKSELLNITVLRDNIGEAMWFIYTAILIISIVSYQLSSQDCTKGEETTTTAPTIMPANSPNTTKV
jgi:hypothetical protein